MLAESAFKSGNLCVVGNLNRDLKTAPMPSGNFLLRDGETSVAGISETIGGGGANSACAAAAIGAKVAFLGKVGADSLGKILEQTLRHHDAPRKRQVPPDRHIYQSRLRDGPSTFR